MYRSFIKPLLDYVLSALLLVLFSPILVVLLVIGSIVFKGNPVFLQERPGKINIKTKKEKIFKLIKLKTMLDIRDECNNPLPDAQRLTRYGKFLRSTSLDELLSLINVLKGDMSLIGPRPLLVKYLPLYTDEQRHRHDVKPGMTGLAQVSGRNLLSFEERFDLDLIYIKNVSFKTDLFIALKTIKCVLCRKNTELIAEYTPSESERKVGI